MTVTRYVLAPELRALAAELAQSYVDGNLSLVAGAGVSRASGLPGWDDMVAAIQRAAADSLRDRVTAEELEPVLATVHRSDPISRADSLQRLLTKVEFTHELHAALYPNLTAGPFRPSVLHWHLASLLDRRLMPEVYTSNYDDLLEDAKADLGRAGRIRHFHGRLPQRWDGASRLGDPPVVTSRDYLAAEGDQRYAKLASTLRNKTVLLIGFSLSDPNLVRVIRSQAQDCRAILIASPGSLTSAQQALRLNLLKRYWHGLKIDVTAIGAHEELPAVMLALRGAIHRLQGRRLSELGERGLRSSARHNPWSWTGAREWREALRLAVVAAKALARGVRADASLRAGFYAITNDGSLVHVIGSGSSRKSYTTWPRRRLMADDERPWGAAGYCYAAGVPITSSATGPAFDRNVPDSELVGWQAERATQRRLPASAVLCEPAWIRYERRLISVGVLYFSSRRGSAFDQPEDAERLRAVLQFTLAAMIKPDNVVEGGAR